MHYSANNLSTLFEYGRRLVCTQA